MRRPEEEKRGEGDSRETIGYVSQAPKYGKGWLTPSKEKEMVGKGNFREGLKREVGEEELGRERRVCSGLHRRWAAGSSVFCF